MSKVLIIQCPECKDWKLYYSSPECGNCRKLVRRLGESGTNEDQTPTVKILDLNAASWIGSS